MSFSLDSPLALYSIPAAWVTVVFPALLRTASISKISRFNNVAPRQNIERLEKKGIPAETVARLQRMSDANANGNEVLPLWLAAVIIGTYAKVENRTLNWASIAFVGFRMIYNTIYINQSSAVTAGLRSITWWASVLTPLTVIVKAANKLNA